ncbi:DUF1127 domain-containing protein [Marinimicrococcus flavescens]|uniref:DUF1127 domain-containing protein n=1 Tax=Marinimicrococcus flavescens TaxID=3031815 RepID=A0AAP3XSU9_9PROT|nr:DUF1127 domain-containing protein [Marinimicrococcus flavescens]
MTFLQRIRSTFDAWRRERVTINELNMLSDRDLADLGISRSDIRSLARQTVKADVVDLHEWRDRNQTVAAPVHARAA